LESTFPAFGRAKTVHASDHAATVMAVDPHSELVILALDTWSYSSSRLIKHIPLSVACLRRTAQLHDRDLGSRMYEAESDGVEIMSRYVTCKVRYSILIQSP
jgi:hypothetical protein